MMTDGPLSRLLSALTGPRAPEPLPEPDARLALGALLVRVARSDHDYVVEEIARIDLILAKRFDLNAVDAAKLRATCEKLSAATPETESLAALVRDGVAYKDRLAILQDLAQVMLADGVRDDREILLIDQVTELLGISDNDSRDARDLSLVIP